VIITDFDLTLVERKCEFGPVFDGTSPVSSSSRIE